MLGRCSGGGGCGQFNNFVELSTVGCAGGVCGGGRRGRRFAGKVRKGQGSSGKVRKAVRQLIVQKGNGKCFGWSGVS